MFYRDLEKREGKGGGKRSQGRERHTELRKLLDMEKEYNVGKEGAGKPSGPRQAK